MSILRRALAIPHEERATGVTILPSSGNRVPEPPDGYGQVGYGGWGQGMVWHSSTATGGPVTTDSALTLSAVFACLRLLSEAVATLPLDTFSRDAGTRVPYPRPEYLLFDPPGLSRINYLSQVMLSLLTDGNAFVYTPRGERDEPTKLVPLQPEAVTVCREKSQIYYEVAGSNERWTPLDIMHIPGMMLPGALRGVSPLQAAREVIDGGRKAQEFGSTFLGNHAVPPAIIEVPSTGGDPDAERSKAKKVGQMWQESHGGANAGKVGVLYGGATLKTIAVSPEDAEWLSSKQFSVSEIARFYGVPPHLIADASNSTSWGSGLAEQNLAFGQFSLRTWTERIEDAHTRLLTTHALGDVFIKLNLDALLRAALKDRYDSYNVGITTGFLTVDEARALEDLPPIGEKDNTMSSRQLAEALQKIYLAVGPVISGDEAREILNREGAGLTGAAPGGAQ